MIMFIVLFGAALLCGGICVAYDERRARNEKLQMIQRELAGREAAEHAKQAANTQD